MVENPIIVVKSVRIRVYPHFNKINGNFWNLIFLRVAEGEWVVEKFRFMGLGLFDTGNIVNMTCVLRKIVWIFLSITVLLNSSVHGKRFITKIKEYDVIIFRF